MGVCIKFLSKSLFQGCRKVRKVVGPNQHGFIPVRQILDTTLIANDCIDSYIKSGNSSIICKLDVEKAYDHFY